MRSLSFSEIRQRGKRRHRTEKREIWEKSAPATKMMTIQFFFSYSSKVSSISGLLYRGKKRKKLEVAISGDSFSDFGTKKREFAVTNTQKCRRWE